MSGSVHAKLEEANERNALITEHGNRLVPLAAAIIAVLAALGTLFSHHRSISALTAKNEAILMQARASDRYNNYEAKRIRYHLYSGLLAAGLPQAPAGRAVLKEIADKEDASSLKAQSDARDYEKRSAEDEDRSEKLLQSYETLEIGTTFFEISIVLVSISALARTRIFLSLGCGLSAIGLAFLIYGYIQGH